nr:MAG TPA: hypothetical protein [Siphoviridae sp. ct7JV2]
MNTKTNSLRKRKARGKLPDALVCLNINYELKSLS